MYHCTPLGFETSLGIEGDHGDPESASQALKQASAKGRPVPLVVFVRMHHMLKVSKTQEQLGAYRRRQ